MKAYIIRIPLGVFAVSEKRKLLDKIIFEKNPEKVAKKIVSEKILEEESKLIKKLEGKGYSDFIFPKKIKSFGYEENNIGVQYVRKHFREIAKNKKLNEFLTKVGIEISRINIKRTVKKDKVIIQAINTVDEIDKSINIFVERLREWYGLHFPEFEQSVDKHEKFVKIISKYGLRENIEEKEFLEIAKKSMGIDLTEDDGKVLKMYAEQIKNLYNLRGKIEKYIEKVMKDIAPNFTELAGALLGARLISLVGGMGKLAKKASSTMQLLGAEKALFRYLKGKGRSPKHGIIFQSPYIQQAPGSKKGKVARILSSKLSIAIKMDWYGSKDKSKKLKKELEGLIKNAVED